MAELGFLRDQVTRLNSVVAKYQEMYPSARHFQLDEESQNNNARGPWLTDPSVMSPLLQEYDGSIREMEGMLGASRDDMTAMKREMELMSAENQRLVNEVRSVMRDTPHGTDAIVTTSDQSIGDDVVVQNLRKQLRSALEEKNSAMEMWKVSCQEIERLQAELKTSRDANSWHVVEDRAQQVEAQYMEAVSQIEGDLKTTHDDLRDTKENLSGANKIIEEKQQLIEDLKQEITLREKERLDISLDGDTVKGRVAEYENTIKTLEARLANASSDVTDGKMERSAWEQKIAEMYAKQIKCEKNERDMRDQVRESVQVVEKALMDRDQAVQLARQKEESYENLENTVTKLLNEEGARTRQEVDSVRQQGNVGLQKLTDEIHELEMTMMEKDAKFDRLVREKQSILTTLDQTSRESQDQSEATRQTFVDLNRRLIESERCRDETMMKLETISHNTRLQELNSKQEAVKQREIIKQLNEQLKRRDGEFVSINEEREKLLNEVDVITVKLQSAQSDRDTAIRKCNKELSISEQEQCLMVQELKAKLTATEDNHRHGMTETRKLLTAQQRMSVRWKEECHSLTHKLETKIQEQREEIEEVKRRNNELTSLLRESQHKTTQAEKMITQYSRKFQRLEDQLRTAEKPTVQVTRIWSTEKESLLRSVNQTLNDSANLSHNPVPHSSSSPIPPVTNGHLSPYTRSPRSQHSDR